MDILKGPFAEIVEICEGQKSEVDRLQHEVEERAQKLSHYKYKVECLQRAMVQFRKREAFILQSVSVLRKQLTDYYATGESDHVTPIRGYYAYHAPERGVLTRNDIECLSCVDHFLKIEKLFDDFSVKLKSELFENVDTNSNSRNESRRQRIPCDNPALQSPSGNSRLLVLETPEKENGYDAKLDSRNSDSVAKSSIKSLRTGESHVSDNKADTVPFETGYSSTSDSPARRKVGTGRASPRYLPRDDRFSSRYRGSCSEAALKRELSESNLAEGDGKGSSERESSDACSSRKRQKEENGSPSLLRKKDALRFPPPRFPGFDDTSGVESSGKFCDKESVSDVPEREKKTARFLLPQFSGVEDNRSVGSPEILHEEQQQVDFPERKKNAQTPRIVSARFRQPGNATDSRESFLGEESDIPVRDEENKRADSPVLVDCDAAESEAPCDKQSTVEMLEEFAKASSDALRDVTNSQEYTKSGKLLFGKLSGTAKSKVQKLPNGVKVQSKDGFDFVPPNPDAKPVRYLQTKLTTDGKVKTHKLRSAAELKPPKSLSRRPQTFETSRIVKNEVASDDEFDQIPKKESVGYRFKEGAVRNKAARAQMPAFACQLCKEFFEGDRKLTDDEIVEKINRNCRHKSYHPPPLTPPNFWNLEMDLRPKTLTPEIIYSEED